MQSEQPSKLSEAVLELVARDDARDSLLAFTQRTHANWHLEAHHEKVCYRLEQLERREICTHCGKRIDKLANFAPPRSGKTELSLRRFSAWAMGRNPGWHVISAMANGNLAADTGGEVRDIVDSEEFRKIFPEITLKADAKAANRWIVEAGKNRGVYYCGGVDSSFPGRGANILNIDDPHKSAQEADSQRMRDLAAKFYFGDAVHRLENPHIQLLTNTRRHQDDLAGRILPPTNEWMETDDHQFFCCANGWHVLRLRGIENEGTPYEVALGTRASQGEDPLAHMKEVRDLYLSSNQSRYWSSEFQQEPTPDTGEYCRREWFDERYSVVPNNLRVYMASDFAVSTPREGAKSPDFTEHGVFGVAEDDKIYAIDWWSGQTDPDVWIDELIRLFRKHNPIAWFGEAGAIRRAVESVIKRRMREERTYTRVEWLPPTADKGIRGRAFQVWASSGRVIFPERVPWAERVIDNCVAFPTASHDDAFDVCSTMMRAIDQTHPAMRATAKKHGKKVDGYAPFEVIEGGVGWKTA